MQTFMRGSMIRGVALLLLTGCMSNNSLETMSLAQENTWNLSEICVGMKEDQVLRIMRHPYTKKTVTHDGIIYNIWFYVTKQTALNQSRLLAQNLTPLTFENGVLKGWGFVYYHRVLEKIERSQAQQETPAPRAPAPSKSNPEESKSLENTIDATEKAPPSKNPPQKGETIPKKPTSKEVFPKKTQTPQKQPASQEAPPPQKGIDYISFSSQPKPQDPKKDKPQTDKEKKSEERKEKRDEAIQQDNEQNFDFW